MRRLSLAGLYRMFDHRNHASIHHHHYDHAPGDDFDA